ncbi:MAG: hypothetical protein M3220_11895 [Chloroflexota bacterium]|nr:hypothetical protein [Chloroflexota bacterium]
MLNHIVEHPPDISGVVPGIVFRVDVSISQFCVARAILCTLVEPMQETR